MQRPSPLSRPVTRPGLAFQPDAGNQFFGGIAALADMLALTLGPTSGPVMSYDETRRKAEVLDDAATTLRRILGLGRPDLDVGAMLLRGVVWRLEQQVGDGGATAVVLMRALIAEGMRQVSSGANAMRLIEGMRRGAVVALDALRSQSHPVTGERSLAAVARAVMQDDDLAAVLGEMSYLLGADGHLQIESYVAPYLERQYLGGAHYGAEISSMYFYTEPERKRTVLSSPAVALLDKPLTEAEQAVALLEAAINAGRKSLLIIAPDVSGPALNLLVTNHMQPADKRKLIILAVKPKAVGDERRFALQDLAAMTGAAVLGEIGERTARTARAEDLGIAQRVEFADRSLVVTMESERRSVIQEQIVDLGNRLARTPYDDDERPILTRRLAALTGGIGVLKIGAYHQPARDLRRAQAERAWKVLSAVQRGGVVAGGGGALLHCQSALLAAAVHEPEADCELGMRVLAQALLAPQRQILTNAGVTAPAVYLQRLVEMGAPATYDVASATIVDAQRSGLLDATDVVAAVLQAAVSGAIMALSTDAIVYHRKPQQSFTP
jgi:chaperonin GroEL